MPGNLWKYPPVPPGAGALGWPIPPDPRIGTDEALHLGQIVKTRGNHTLGTITSLYPRGSSHLIGFQPNGIAQPLGMFLYYWQIGSPAPGNQLALEQLMRQKRELPIDIGGIIGEMAGTSDPGGMVNSNRQGYRTGTSRTNERPTNATATKKGGKRKCKTRKTRR